MAKHTFTFNKLVRDAIVSMSEADGATVSYRTLEGDAYRAALETKITEELEELQAAQTPADIAGELADITEILMAIAAHKGISPADIEAQRQKKFTKRGGFALKHFIDTVTVDEADPMFDYYNKNPEKFPKIG